MSREDERYLSSLAIAADVPMFRLWYALTFTDRSALCAHEWQRLRLFHDYANLGGNHDHG
jgi:hypothetical protein